MSRAVVSAMFSVELPDRVPRKASEILDLQGDARITDEGDQEYRVGADVVAWFTIAGSVASVVSAIAAVAAWASKSGGSGSVDLRELPAQRTDEELGREGHWNHSDDLTALSGWVDRAEGPISVRIK